MKKVAFTLLFIILIFVFNFTVIADTYMKYEKNINSSCNYAIDFEDLNKKFQGITTLSILNDNKKIDYKLVKLIPESINLSQDQAKLSYYYTYKNNNHYLIDNNEKYIHSISFHEIDIKFAYEVDVYTKNKNSTYSLLKDGVKIYYYRDNNMNLSIEFDKAIKKPLKLVFKNSLNKLKQNKDINIELLTSKIYYEEYDYSQPLLISNYKENDLYYNLYDFGKTVFINNFSNKQEYDIIKNSNDNVIYTTITENELKNGIETRFLLIGSNNKFDSKIIFELSTRYILLKDIENKNLSIHINNRNDKPLTNNYAVVNRAQLENYAILDIEDFSYEEASTENIKGNSLILEIIAALIIFMIYPVYLIYRYIKRRNYTSSS